MFSRREFLKILGAGAGVSVLAARSSGGLPADLGRADVLVIGAGMAGLAAGARLAKAGLRPLLLEGRSGIGGRVFTSREWPDCPVDLGASWIHGINENPLTALAREAGAKIVETSYHSAIRFFADGRKFDTKTQRKLSKISDSFRIALDAAGEKERDRSVLDALGGVLAGCKSDTDSRQLAHFLINSLYEQEYAGSANRLSAWWFEASREFGGGDVLFPGGYGSLAEHLASGLEIKKDAVVTKITVTGGEVAAQTADGSRYVAKHCVVTLPLGVLKSGSVEFAPVLSAKKRNAIRALGMGLLNKCILRFERPFWPADVDWLEVVPEEPGRWTEWVSLMNSCKQPVLIGFNAADFASKLERLDDAATVQSAMRALRGVFGNAIPEPTGALVTRWAEDPFFRGSYSYNAVGSNPRMRDSLAATEHGCIFFAGEATSRKDFATVHGAYLSGVSAADRLIAKGK
jgi:monoamine oxidase